MTALLAKFCTGTPTGIRFTTKRDSIPVCLKHWIISAAMTAGTVKKRGFQPLFTFTKGSKKAASFRRSFQKSNIIFFMNLCSRPQT
jgi:hypothetical protein